MNSRFCTLRQLHRRGGAPSATCSQQRRVFVADLSPWGARMQVWAVWTVSVSVICQVFV